MTLSCCLFLFIDPATTEIYTLSLHDALPIYRAPLLVLGSVTTPVARFLDACVRAGLNFVVAGGTQATRLMLKTPALCHSEVAGDGGGHRYCGSTECAQGE